MKNPRAVAVILVIAIGSLWWFSRLPQPDEALIHAMFDRMHEAAETRNTGAFMAEISADYHDPAAQTPADLRNRLRLIFLRRPALHLYRHLHTLEIQGEQASAELFIAAAASPISDLAALPQLRAETFKLTLMLSRASGEWHVASAAWERLTPQSLLELLY